MINVRRVIHEEYLRQRSIPFEWGKTDCFLFVADMALLLTGKDKSKGIRGNYDSQKGANKIMSDNEWKTLGDGAAAMFPEIPVAMAKSGDWAFIDNGDGTESLGVVFGPQIIARTQSGVGMQPLTKASRAFRVVE
jgi:hypothetical protein